MLKKIISGGQTGADQGGLEAAQELGLPTGGWAPKGFLTEVGSNPSLGEKYGLVEHNSEKYPPRTYANVRDSDGTIMFLSPLRVSSPGTKCTKKAVDFYNKAWHTLPVQTGESGRNEVSEVFLSGTMEWIEENGIEVLNVAGNRESKCPGIQRAVKEYVEKVVRSLNGRSSEHSGNGGGGEVENNLPQ